MFKRKIKPILGKALNRSPVVLINGARQVGKTTLALEFVQEKDYNYVTFDDEITYLAAKSDISGFILSLKKPVIIDEIQRVPEIFLAIKRDVDINRIPGRYLLTGSANPLLIPRLGDSLAGRLEVIDLMPLSQGEIYNHDELFIETLFNDKQLRSPKEKLSKENLYKRIITGGYPAVQKTDEESSEAWMYNYLNLLLQKDVKDLASIEKLTEFPKLLNILSHRTSNLLNVAEIARDIKIVTMTVHRYLALLEAIFIVNLVQAWSANFTIRFMKSPKVYLIDSGLLSYLLDVTLEKVLIDSVAGKLLENFVVNELKKQMTWSKIRVQLYHFRALSGEEVDIVLENRSGYIVGIEVKNSETVVPQDFKGLKYLQEKAKKKFIKGIVLYNGSQYIPFGENLFALPINSLWQQISE